MIKIIFFILNVIFNFFYLKNILSKIECFNRSNQGPFHDFAQSLWPIDPRLDPIDHCISFENSMFEKTASLLPWAPSRFRWKLSQPATYSVIARYKVCKTCGVCLIKSTKWSLFIFKKVEGQIWNLISEDVCT